MLLSRCAKSEDSSKMSKGRYNICGIPGRTGAGYRIAELLILVLGIYSSFRSACSRDQQHWMSRDVRLPVLFHANKRGCGSGRVRAATTRGFGYSSSGRQTRAV